MSEGPREETNKEFIIFSEAREVHTWPEAWIGFNDEDSEKEVQDVLPKSERQSAKGDRTNS